MKALCSNPYRRTPSARRLRLEFLEERAMLAVFAGALAGLDAPNTAEPAGSQLIVTTLADTVDDTDGVLSLREAIDAANSGDRITFSSKLAGGTISLTGSGLWMRDKGVSIDASSVGGITIDGGGKYRVMSVIGNEETEVQFTGIAFTGGNDRNRCGGIFIDMGVKATFTGCTVSNCAVSNSSLEEYGGGIYAHYNSFLTLVGCTVSNNTSDLYGGGVYANAGTTVTIIDSTITGNSASSRGGGLYVHGTASLTNCVITDNSVTGNTDACGGGVSVDRGGSVLFANCTVVKNHADARGGGLYAETESTATLQNSIVLFNTAGQSGSDIYGERYESEEKTSVSYLYGCNNLTTFTGWTSSVNTYAYKSASPLFTNSSAGNYTLAKNSQAIGKGNNCFVTRLTDFSGSGRINNKVVDLGAYEYQTSVSRETPSTIVTTYFDVVDDTDGYISLREALQFYASPGETVTFADTLRGKTILLCGYELLDVNDVSIDASPIGGITIDADEESRVVSVRGDSVHFKGVTFTGGSCAGDGGGIYLVPNSALTLTSCAVTENTVLDGLFSGGGIFAGHSCTLTLTDCTISDNSARYSGGGISVGNFGTLSLANCLVSDNSAVRLGGGINVYGGTAVLTNCTVTKNSAVNFGGGINADAGSFTLQNTILLFNTSREFGSDIYNNRAVLYAYNTLSSFTDWTDSANTYTYNISLPLFTNPGNGDYTLARNSQGINKGNNSYNETTVDLAGNPRIVGGIIDLGAYEFQNAAQLDAPRIINSTASNYISCGANRHQLQWSAVDGAAGYEINYSGDGKTWKTVRTNGNNTSLVITGLTYGSSVRYRVKALAAGAYTDSDWCSVKSFLVCPMDINGDGEIAGVDRTLFSRAWLSEEGDDEYKPYCDIDGDGEVASLDRTYILRNWLSESTDDDLRYPEPLAAVLVDDALTDF